MREANKKQLICISETNAAIFENKVNAALAGLTDPEIRFDKAKPFTVYIVYSVRKDIPENVLELLELTDPDGGNDKCEQCDHFVRSTDGRRKWHKCGLDGHTCRADSRACEKYYLEKRQRYAAAIRDYQNIPHVIE